MTSAKLRIDSTSLISVISLATEQIFGAYQPIKESKNAVTSFLSLKRTQSPADYSINLLMNLSTDRLSLFLWKAGWGVERLKEVEPSEVQPESLKVLVNSETHMLNFVFGTPFKSFTEAESRSTARDGEIGLEIIQCLKEADLSSYTLEQDLKTEVVNCVAHV